MDAPREAVPLPDDVPTLQRMVRELLATVAELRRTVEAQQAPDRRADPATLRHEVRAGRRGTDAPDTRR